MAQSINEIKAKILSTQNMSKITKAMQMVSAAKLNKTELKVKSYWNYTEALEAMMKNILSTSAAKEHVFFQPTCKKKCTAFLVITSDRGLAGGYNNNVLKLLQQEINGMKPEEYKIYMLGNKGFSYARRFGLTIENDYIFLPDDMVSMDIGPIVNRVLVDYAKGLVSELVVVYNDYVSKIQQEPTMKQMLPLQQPKNEAGKVSSRVYIMEPSEGEIIQATLLQYLSSSIYGAALTAKLSEHSARMNAMQSATDNATDIIKESQLIYNRARQAAITQEINEIVGGAAAL